MIFLVKNDSLNHFFAFFRHEESPESQMSLNPYEKLDNLAVLGAWKSQRIMNFTKKSFLNKRMISTLKNDFGHKIMIFMKIIIKILKFHFPDPTAQNLYNTCHLIDFLETQNGKS